MAVFSWHSSRFGSCQPTTSLLVGATFSVAYWTPLMGMQLELLTSRPSSEQCWICWQTVVPPCACSPPSEHFTPSGFFSFNCQWPLTWAVTGSIFTPQYFRSAKICIFSWMTSHLFSFLPTQGKGSHKSMDETSNPIMRIYYTSRPVLFGMCAGNEIFYASLYLLHFTYGPFYIFYVTAILCFPVAIAKLAIALYQVGSVKKSQS